MRINSITISLASLALCVSIPSIAYDNSESDEESKGSYSYTKTYTSTTTYTKKTEYDGSDYHDGEEKNEEDEGKKFALKSIAYGQLYEKEVEDIDGDKYPDYALCLHATLYSLSDDSQVGYSKECYSEEMYEGDGKKLIKTIYFHFDDGYFVARSHVTVQPILHYESKTPDGYDVTHITGSSDSENSVIKGKDAYKWHQGALWQSGMANFSGYTGTEGDTVYTKSIYYIDLKEVKPKYPRWYNWYRKHYYHDSKYYDKSGDDKGKKDESDGGYEKHGY